jgi:hypothetical protein
MFGNNYASLKELYQHELAKKNINQSDIDFVVSLIRESDSDERLNRMDNNYWKELQNRGLLEIFEEISKENNIVWNHSNEEER